MSLKWFLLALLVAVLGPVKAETIAATPAYAWVNGSIKNSSWAAVAAAHCTASGSTVYTDGNGKNAFYCTVGASSQLNPVPTPGSQCAAMCANTATKAFTVTTNGYQCPTGQNWTLNGSNCTRPDCTAGTVRNPSNGLCEVDCSPGGVWAKAYTGTSRATSDPPPATLCVAGCVFTRGPNVCLVGDSCTVTLGQATGAPCTPSTSVPEGRTLTETEKTCAAKGLCFASINSTTMCLTCGKSETSQKDTKTVTNMDGSGQTTGTSTTSVDKKTTVEPSSSDPNAVVVKVITTTVNPDGTQTVSETSTEQKKATFCEQNPTSNMCKPECEDNPQLLKCAEFGDPTAENPSVESKNVPLTFGEVAIAENATCPSPQVLTLHGFSLDVDYDPACRYALGLRPVVLALAYLGAALIVIGAFKEQ